MEYKVIAQKIKTFLESYQNIWSNEIMNQIPQGVNHYPLEWREQLEKLSLDEEYLFETQDIQEIPEFLKNTGLGNFLKEALDLTHVPFVSHYHNEELPLENWAFHGVKKKKKHEIQKIAPVLKNLFDQKKFKYIVDIGGGVGHLSRVLSHYHQIPSLSIDQNKEFQQIGMERLNKFRKLDGARDVNFINLTFGDEKNDPHYKEKINQIYHQDAFSIGLHTCGNLANILIENTISHQAQGLLSFGCCYYRMNPAQDFPKSNFYKDQGSFKLNQYSLTLATRAHCKTDRETFDTKKQVKNYRYALHLLLIEKFNIDNAFDVGECHTRTYWLDFHVYASEKLNYLNLSHSLSNTDLDAFYWRADIQKELRDLFLCNLVRWKFGRLLELYILLDRCLYLEEAGFKVELSQFFNEEESPRNLGILAYK